MDVTVEQIARVCHEANRGWCEATGDFSQVPWEDAPGWQRESAIDGVSNALRGATPEQSHENWMRTRVGDGWVHGAVKDPERKTHPCIVPYVELPPDQRVKDALFVAVVSALSS